MSVRARVLVVGGAGYIGSHMVKLLCGLGHEVVAFDNLSSGYRDAVLGGRLVVGDLADARLLDEVLAGGFDVVMHFASHIAVGESVLQPAKYYRNNVTHALSLLDAMLSHEVKHFIFSSTAAIFGEPRYTPIDERHPKEPINPYGRSKWMVEQALADFDGAYGLRSVSLRYFNAAGADPSGALGERHVPETHLIPLVLQVASGRRPHIEVFGRDYPTEDGTCVRDYIHVVDLCRAHLQAMEYLLGGGTSTAYNLGNGAGFSVQRVIDAARRVTGRPIRTVYAGRRPGDAAVLVADSTRARQELQWTPEYPEIETILAHAWQWETKSHAIAHPAQI